MSLKLSKNIFLNAVVLIVACHCTLLLHGPHVEVVLVVGETGAWTTCRGSPGSGRETGGGRLGRERRIRGLNY